MPEQEVLALFLPMVPPLDPLQLLLVDHVCGYTEFQNGGQVCPLEDTDSGNSTLHASPSPLEEEVLENLGDEWRILYPFDLPLVRHPTDATPLNQRRLAENDALVELIQTTEYLEDTPMWGQRDY